MDDPDGANCSANIALISRATNAECGDKRPKEVLTMLTPNQRKVADLHFFGDSGGDRLQHDRYEEFCEWRGQRLAQALNEYLGMRDGTRKA